MEQTERAESIEQARQSGLEVLDRVFDRIHNRPIRLVDVFVAARHVDDGTILDSRDERALREASAWLARVEGYELLAETCEALAVQRGRGGIKESDVKELRALFDGLVFSDLDRFQKLATIDPEDVV